jgi:hypothetical protein
MAFPQTGTGVGSARVLRIHARVVAASEVERATESARLEGAISAGPQGWDGFAA